MLLFEWNDEKAKANLDKHGVPFEVAAQAFIDAFALHGVDDSMDYGEARYWLIGYSNGKLLFVIYTERDDRIRIISARQATRREHEAYHDQYES